MSAKKAWRFASLVAGARHRSKQSLQAMNRFMFGGCLVVFFGCGARTETFTDLDGSSGEFGVGGTAANGGRSAGGAGSFGSGGSGNVGGSISKGGASFGGFGNVAGRGGTTGRGGGGNVAGFPSKGGTTGFGGRGNVAGWIGRGGGIGLAGDGGSARLEEACQAIASNSCQQCMCNTCAPQIVECFSNIGCALIFACAQQTGCQGVGCYSPDTCKPIIDQFGGLNGTATKDVLSLISCAVTAQNSCNCN